MLKAFLTTLPILTLVFYTSVDAAPCSEETISTVNRLNADPMLTQACPDIGTSNFSGTLKNVLAPRSAATNTCGTPACVSVVKSLAPKVPDCEWNGSNLKSLVTQYINACGGENMKESGSTSGHKENGTGSRNNGNGAGSQNKEAGAASRAGSKESGTASSGKNDQEEVTAPPSSKSPVPAPAPDSLSNEVLHTSAFVAAAAVAMAVAV